VIKFEIAGTMRPRHLVRNEQRRPECARDSIESTEAGGGMALWLGISDALQSATDTP
jgi:hypothetical protein